MNIDTHDLLNSIMQSLTRIQHIRPEDLPNIDLYMDQVTTFMDQNLRSATRNPEDKILTKTMINNYAKNNLLPSPNKKKYSKEHMLLLIFIYYFKGVMSIGDIQTLMQPLTDKYFAGEDGFNLQKIYDEVFSLEREEVEKMKRDVIRKFHRAENTFENVPEQERDFLQLFSFICQLCFDIYVKKLLVEKMIDSLCDMEIVQPAGKEKGKKKSE